MLLFVHPFSCGESGEDDTEPGYTPRPTETTETTAPPVTGFDWEIPIHPLWIWPSGERHDFRGFLNYMETAFIEYAERIFIAKCWEVFFLACFEASANEILRYLDWFAIFAPFVKRSAFLWQHSRKFRHPQAWAFPKFSQDIPHMYVKKETFSQERDQSLSLLSGLRYTPHNLSGLAPASFSCNN